MKKLFLIFNVCLILVGCEQSNQPVGTENADKYPANNTGVNVRDRGDTLTPGNQSESEADRNITAQIRRLIMKEDRLSVSGKNVKVITIERVVTLRGPVASQEERQRIDNIAKGVNGVKNVNNQLEVKEQGDQ